MQAFFAALKAQATGADDFAYLRSQLEQLIVESPDSIGQAVKAVDAYFTSGVLAEEEFLQLRGVLKPYINRAVKEPSGGETRLRAPDDATRHRREAAETLIPERRPSGPRDVWAVGDPAANTAQPTMARTAGGEAPSETRMRPEPKPPESDPRPSETDRRWEDPHTWTMASDEPLFEGRILNRRYQLERQLGEGGMGVVWLARDLIEADFSENPYLAVKVLKPDFRKHPDSLRALHEEVRRSKLLSHPNIVSVYTFDRDTATVFMTMEYLDGKTLSHVIEHEFARGMPFAQAWPIIEGAGRALAYAHDRGTIHSDFKPPNVFVMAGGRAKVLDFGIARAIRRGSGRTYDAGSLSALTVEYASCEMLEDLPPDVRDDVYAYGCVAYELLSGRHVFGGKRATVARDKGMKVTPLKELTRMQNKALADALAFEREQRSGSIEEVIAGLQPRPPSTHYAKLTGAAVAILLAFGAGLWWTMDRSRRADEDQQFVVSLLRPNAEANTMVDPDRIALLMGQGDDYLTQAQHHFDPAILSEGVSTAYGAYRTVLRLDPANRAAAEKILEIVKLYESQARALQAEGQFKRAATLVGYALKIAPDRQLLRQLKSDLEPLASKESDAGQ
jgi:serine/threonine protein kinase